MDALSPFQHLWLFAVLVVGIIMLPGLDMALVLGKTLTSGRRMGLTTQGGSVLDEVAAPQPGSGSRSAWQDLIYGGLVFGADGLHQARRRHPQRQKRVAQAVGLVLVLSALWTAATGWQAL